MPLFAVRVSHGRARSRDPCRAQPKSRSVASRSVGGLGARAARLEYGKTALYRRNARPVTSTANTRSQRNHAATERCSAATIGEDGRRPRKATASRGLRRSYRGFEDVQRQTPSTQHGYGRVGLKVESMMKFAKALVLLASLHASAVWATQPTRVQEFSAQCAALYASAFEVPVELVDAVIQVESGWNPYAVSRKGAAGLMQLMPATAIRFGVHDRFNIEENIRGGVAYLAWLIRLFKGDLRLAVAAYQVGESQILSRGLAYSSREVFLYVSRVAQLSRALRRGTARSLAAQGYPAGPRGGQ